MTQRPDLAAVRTNARRTAGEKNVVWRGDAAAAATFIFLFAAPPGGRGRSGWRQPATPSPRASPAASAL